MRRKLLHHPVGGFWFEVRDRKWYRACVKNNYYLDVTGDLEHEAGFEQQCLDRLA